MEAGSLSSRSRSAVALPLAALLTGLTAAISVADYLTGSEISVSFFYLVPVALATWTMGRKAGVAFSVLSAVGWSTAYFVGAHYSNPNIYYWNVALELATYLALTLSLAGLQSEMRKEHALAIQLEQAYLRLDDEQRVVGDLQRGLLPLGPPVLPGISMAIHYVPSSRAGGDYYDFFPLGPGRAGFLIADVSGHGSPAAVVMAMLRVLLHTASEPLDAPERVLASVNARIREFTLRDQFVTACYSVFDASTRQIAYSLAGHNPPLLVRARSGAIEEFENPSGLPLGAFDRTVFIACTTRLEPGDTALFYTDGLTEAMNERGDLFGEERVRELLQRHRCESAARIRDALLAAMHVHEAGAAQTDDVTLIVVQAECAPVASPSTPSS
jgi:serine phosphatase RsbU (regulator of sigma subunit)